MRSLRSRILPIAVLVGAAIGTSCARQEAVRFVPTQGPQGSGFFETDPLGESQLEALEVDWPAAAPDILSVRVDSGERDGSGDVEETAAHSVPPLAGEYRLEGGRLRFQPHFPLAPGVVYRASLEREDGAPLDLTMSIAEPEVEESTLVEAIYPSADTLPENLLKFYVHFSSPMTKGQAWENIRLLDGSGREVELPFLELDEELWDRGLRRLTVLIDPGRVKREVRPLEEVGPSLTAGKEFTLVIDRSWEDARGVPLAEGFRKDFRVAPPDRTQPNPRAWKFTAPRQGTRQPLTVIFDEPLDHGLLHSAIGVEAPGGAGIDGAIETDIDETVWSFTPRREWSAGEHQLVVLSTLEDLAGNSVGRPFEVDATEPVRREVTIDVVRLPFEPTGK